MRGEKLKIFLEQIGETALFTGDLFEAFLSAGYGASYRRLEYQLSKIKSAREYDKFKQELEKKRRQRYYNFVHYLKQDGLIKDNDKEGQKKIIRTLKGRERLKELKKRQRHQLPSTKYRGETSTKLIIIAFDIPEKDRRKRDWLRSALQNLGLKKVQLSLWIGNIKVPTVFLKDLNYLKLNDAVEIFEVTKKGTLRHLLNKKNLYK